MELHAWANTSADQAASARLELPRLRGAPVSPLPTAVAVEERLRLGQVPRVRSVRHCPAVVPQTTTIH